MQFSVTRTCLQCHKILSARLVAFLRTCSFACFFFLPHGLALETVAKLALARLGLPTHTIFVCLPTQQKLCKTVKRLYDPNIPGTWLNFKLSSTMNAGGRSNSTIFVLGWCTFVISRLVVYRSLP